MLAICWWCCLELRCSLLQLFCPQRLLTPITHHTSTYLPAAQYTWPMPSTSLEIYMAAQAYLLCSEQFGITHSQLHSTLARYIDSMHALSCCQMLLLHCACCCCLSAVPPRHSSLHEVHACAMLIDCLAAAAIQCNAIGMALLNCPSRSIQLL